MSEDDYGFPHIPCARLKELRRHAEMVVIAAMDGSFTGRDLWRIYVGLEVNSLLANHWYAQVQELKEKLAHYVQEGSESDSTPTESEGNRP